MKKVLFCLIFAGYACVHHSEAQSCSNTCAKKMAAISSQLALNDSDEIQEIICPETGEICHLKKHPHSNNSQVYDQEVAYNNQPQSYYNTSTVPEPDDENNKKSSEQKTSSCQQSQQSNKCPSQKHLPNVAPEPQKRVPRKSSRVKMVKY